MYCNIFLYQNNPNPFNPTTAIEYSLVIPSDVLILMYNIKGQLVDVIQNGSLSTGFHSVYWTSGDLSSDIYFIEIKAGTFHKV